MGKLIKLIKHTDQDDLAQQNPAFIFYSRLTWRFYIGKYKQPHLHGPKRNGALKRMLFSCGRFGMKVAKFKKKLLRRTWVVGDDEQLSARVTLPK